MDKIKIISNGNQLGYSNQEIIKVFEQDEINEAVAFASSFKNQPIVNRGNIDEPTTND